MVLVPALLTGGCGGGITDGGQLKRFTDLVRGDDTLTKAEKEAAISELQEDKERQDRQTGADAAPKAN